MKRLKLFCFLFVLAPAFTFGQDPTAIMEDYFNAVSNGDVSRWNNIKSAFIETSSAYSTENYNTKSIDHSEKKPSRGMTYRVWPDKTRIDGYEDTTWVSTIYHVGSKHVFFMDKFPPTRMSSGPYEPHFEFETVMVKHAFDKRKKLKFEGMKEIDSISYYDVSVKTDDLLWHFYFNPETYLLEFWSNTPAGEPGSLTHVSDYKKYGDLLIPTVETKRTTGGEFFWCTRKKIELDTPIDPTVFAYPEK